MRATDSLFMHRLPRLVLSYPVQPIARFFLSEEFSSWNCEVIIKNRKAADNARPPFVYLVQNTDRPQGDSLGGKSSYPHSKGAILSQKHIYTPSYPRYPHIFGNVDKQKLWKLKEQMFCEVVMKVLVSGNNLARSREAEGWAVTKKWNISHELLQQVGQICYNDYTIIQWKGWVIWNL